MVKGKERLEKEQIWEWACDFHFYVHANLSQDQPHPPNLNLLLPSFYVIPHWWSASLPCLVLPGPPKEQSCKWTWHYSPPTTPSTYCSADSPALYIHTPHPPCRASHSDIQSLHTLVTYTTSQYTRSRERQRFVWPRRNSRLIGLAAGPLLCWRRSRGWGGFLWGGQRRRGGERGHRVAQRRFWRWLLGHWGGIERWLGRWWGEWEGEGEAEMKLLVGWLRVREVGRWGKYLGKPHCEDCLTAWSRRREFCV